MSSLLDPAIPIPRQYAIRPYALTNPIWVDRDGNGFDAPGVPAWVLAPDALRTSASEAIPWPVFA